MGVVLSMTWDIYIGKLRSSLIVEQFKAGSVSLVFFNLCFGVPCVLSDLLVNRFKMEPLKVSPSHLPPTLLHALNAH